ncbi:MAG TPA: hypothetical protein PK596_08575, partial [Bacteroidales bacterium]|nr:hypothetical protein [Bacteroidales bacterium]
MKRMMLLTLMLPVALLVNPQGKKALTIDDLVTWNRISERVISDDGSLIAFRTEPLKGDPVITLYDGTGSLKATFRCATGATVSSDSRFLFFTIKPPEEEVRALRLKKTKKDDMPLDKLGIYNVTTGITDTVARLKSYKTPDRWSGWLAWQCEPLKEKPAAMPDTAAGDNGKGKKPKSESADNGYTLYVRNLASGLTDTVRFVTDYLFAEEAEKLMYATTGEDGIMEPGVTIIDLKRGEKSMLYTGKAKYRQLAMDKKGERAAFIISFDEKDKAGNTYSLCFWNGKGVASAVATKGTAGLPEGWIINENARLSFAEKSPRLFFGTSPEYKIRDTTILEDERAVVDVWHWSEGVLHTAQVVRKAREMKRTYTAVCHTDRGKVVQLATAEMPEVQLPEKGDGATALGISSLPYELESMWEGRSGNDLWTVDIMTGNAVKIKENLKARPRFSPGGRYLYWYHGADSSWYSYDVTAGKETRLTTPATLRV